ncbi:TylF/MycF/NovP-related O-methyltransferase [Candidatus Methylomirabilis sp.]|uniref:TylF/MycF/NovP-related O-methyltransferase n=1 Tax=Candidatus Methylomirabilis sp. TaxID=2032687 RepID=UPI0030765E25
MNSTKDAVVVWESPMLRYLVKRYVPPSVVNSLLLMVPSLYPGLRYESQLSEEQRTVLIELLGKGIPGNVIECGVYRGGTTVLMALYLKKEGSRRKKIYALDSFMSFPTDEVNGEIGRGLVPEQGRTAFTSTSSDYVQRKVDRLGLHDMIEIVPGYFEDTLDTIKDSFCLALIDCDLEKSVEYCLTTLWDRVIKGGHIVVDDYTNPGYPGARIAADRFLSNVNYTQRYVCHGLLVIEK